MFNIYLQGKIVEGTADEWVKSVSDFSFYLIHISKWPKVTVEIKICVSFFLNYIFVFRKQYMKNRCVACPLMDEGPGGVYRMENNRQ